MLELHIPCCQGLPLVYMDHSSSVKMTFSLSTSSVQCYLLFETLVSVEDIKVLMCTMYVRMSVWACVHECVPCLMEWQYWPSGNQDRPHGSPHHTISTQ